jgi:hypothetical protein
MNKAKDLLAKLTVANKKNQNHVVVNIYKNDLNLLNIL